MDSREPHRPGFCRTKFKKFKKAAEKVKFKLNKSMNHPGMLIVDRKPDVI